MYEIVIGRSEQDRKTYGLDGTILLGKHYVQMTRTTALSNDVYLDANRAHVVFVVGKRGSGKCVTGDTLISLADGRLVPISKLEHDASKVVSVDDRLRTVAAAKTGFYKRTVSKLLKVTLRSGKTIKLTPEHPLLCIYGWAKAAAFSPGDRIATPRTLPNFGSTSMPEHEIKLLAYLIAEGHLAQGVLFANTDPRLVEDFSEAATAFDPNIGVAPLKPGCYRLYTKNFTSKILSAPPRTATGQFNGSASHTKTTLRQFLERHELYGKRSAEKTVPEAVMQLRKPLLSLFLRLMFSCDGSIYQKSPGYWQISYSTISTLLAQQIHHLLLRYGILSRIRHKKMTCNGKKFDADEIVIDGEHVLTFLEQIGFFGRKEARVQQALREIAVVKRNPNVDTIPKGLWHLYRPKNWSAVGRALSYSHPKAARERIRYAPSRQTLLTVAQSEENDFLHMLATSDIFWDEISTIEEMTGQFEVYDLTVPGLHNFVAGDIVVHNSYSMGAMAEAIAALPTEIRQNISVILLDTMGIYWTMRYENKQDKALLKQWGLSHEEFNLKIYTPQGYFAQYKEKGIPTDAAFAIKPSELSVSDWCNTFNISITDPIGVLIARAIENARKHHDNYSIEQILHEIKGDDRTDIHTQAAAENLFSAAQHWGLFSEQGTAVKDLAVGGQITVLDVSCYASEHSSTSIRALVIGLLGQRLFDERMSARKAEEFAAVKKATLADEEVTAQMPMVWLMVDEAHEFLPKQGSTPATKALLTLLREGRQPGISLVLASQQPGQIHTDVITQSDVVIAHRLTAQVDVDALGLLMQSYLRRSLDKELAELPRVKGAALIFDDTNERLYPVQIRPRITWHGGASPVAIREEKSLYDEL